MNLKIKSYQELKQILDYIQNWEVISKEQNVINISLLSGLPGIIMTLIDANAVFPELVSVEKIKTLLKYLLHILNESESFLPSYCGGIAGLGFFLHNLNEKNDYYNSDYDEILVEVDKVLNDIYTVEIEEDNIDILHGVLGIGLYFIKRKKNKEVSEIIHLLEKTAIIKENQICWKVSDRNDKNLFFYDFGLAHGNTGILYFLLKSIKHDILRDKSTKLARGLISFFAFNTQKIDIDIYSFYQYKIETTAFDSSDYEPVNSRLAWCYGDLGIYHTLLLASSVLEDKVLEKYVIDKLTFISSRLNKSELTKHQMDSGFCHGTSGVAFIFKNIYDLTKDECFLKAVDYWTIKTFEGKDVNSYNGFNVLGYSFPVFENTTQNITLLEGLAGVAAANLKFLSNKPLIFIEEAVFLTI